MRTNEVVLSSRWKAMLGYRDEELTDRFETWRDLVHPDDVAPVLEKCRLHLAGEIDGHEIEVRMRHRAGGYRDIHCRAVLVRDDQQRPLRLLGTHVDITERKQAMRALRRSEEMLRRTQAIAHVAGWSYDIASGRVDISEEGRRIMGWGAADHSIAEGLQAVHPDDLQRVVGAWEAAIAGAPYEIEFRLVTAGQTRWVYSRATTDRDRDGKPVTVVGVTQDVTARRKLEEQFQHAQRMECIGQLAGGIAHDFNNLTTVINCSAEHVLDELSEGPLRDAVMDIRRAGDRAAALTQQLLAFSRKQIVQPRPLDLNAVIVELQRTLGRVIGEDIAVATVLDPALSRVHADPAQIDHVILNIVMNARESMPTGGRLTIATRDVVLEAGMHEALDVKPGRYVELSITDTGVGMPEHLHEKIFEPFFTTKAEGTATGLGLSTVYGVMKQNEGHVSVDSAVGVGTSLRLLLPAIAPPAETSVGPVAVSALPRGSETILLVEDDEVVRRIARVVLERSGYTVLEAESAGVAAELAWQHASSIDLLVTDVVMPGMSGRQVAKLLTAWNRGLPVLYMSGYTNDALLRNGVHEGRDHFIAKPFTPLSLIEKVREALDCKDPARRHP